MFQPLKRPPFKPKYLGDRDGKYWTAYGSGQVPQERTCHERRSCAHPERRRPDPKPWVRMSIELARQSAGAAFRVVRQLPRVGRRGCSSEICSYFLCFLTRTERIPHRGSTDRPTAMPMRASPEAAGEDWSHSTKPPTSSVRG